MKKNFTMFIIIIIITIILGGILINIPPKILDISFSEDISLNNTQTMTIKFAQYHPFNSKCRINNNKWVKAKNNVCEFEVKTGEYTIEIKNLFTTIKETKKVIINGIKSIALEGKKVYLAVDETLELYTKIETVGEADKTLTWKSSNPDVVSVDNGKITGLKNGEATITVYANNDESYSTNIIVTDLIKPMTLNTDKTTLPCNHYTEEESKLLDDILKTKVELKGERTRAALIEVIRFLTLSFEYKVPYFFENGRLENYGNILYVDGEGRYYKKGLYLHENKKKDIISSFVGPSIWGCPLTNFDDSYGWGVGYKYPNGLDCSGFVTWALYNSGLDIGDIGSGVSYGVEDVSDIGEMHELTYEFANSGKYKVGDIIARDGHTALIAGIDDEYIYIAESLLKGVTIEKFSYVDPNSRLYLLYGFINTLDNVYESDGIYENMW